MITYLNLGNGGRLGNQMFQYATLLSVATKNGYEYGIPFENENNLYSHLDLNTKQLIYNSMDLLKAFNLSCNNVKDKTTFINKFNEKEGWKFDKSIFNIQDNTNIEGYFQSELYFKDIEHIIKKEFQFKDYILNTCTEKRDKWNDGRDLVAIHIRRGDYLGYPLIMAISGTDYYERALKNFTDKDYKYIIFSDDLKWSKNCFGEENEDLIYCENEGPIAHIYDLCQMSLCDHFIIAPSSFSWWAAWLSSNKNKKVIRPLQPFPPNNTHDYYPNEWIAC